jgi:CBS domain-containing protein
MLFETQGFHHVPVVDGHKLVGLVSYTDYLRVIRELYSEQSSKEASLNSVKVSQMMTTELICLAPLDTVEDAMRVFNANKFHAVPVVEGDNRLVGIVSTFDLIKMLEKVLAPEIDYAA